ncbi:phage protein [Rhodococcus aetherivorans]|uniref:Phage protein n=1 Tax=Rhodococcus aetherivorans TaxID=191292 RepID=A0ABQ0YSR9_9NOCA|nr:HNH endonuclease [Rhodococcus aetherivorans]ETT26222.1 hypothetical protein RR21198_3100 [Rhodococcus rhodochrous ATCC 21198]NGP25890.1 HNH endonuclease [Rhodococcus aetherivorans]GES39455.1 phage protein [Rhodococcus aetherivorans]
MDERTEQRFWQRIIRREPDECWWWNGATNGGFGQFTVATRPQRIRRPAQAFAWELAGGTVPDGHRIGSTCGERMCVNPAHLSVQTQSDYARWSDEALRNRFWRRVEKLPDGCWEWTGHRSTLGYGMTTHKSRSIGAHRLAWIITHGPIPAGMFICHHCDNPPCCNPAHLFMGSPAANSFDMANKGRAARHIGTRSAGAKFTAEEVRRYRARYAAGGVSSHELAREAGVASMTMWRMLVGRSYTDVM